MNLPFSLRRSPQLARSVYEFEPKPEPARPPHADNQAQETLTLDSGLISHYANRRMRLPVRHDSPTPVPEPGPVLPIGRGSAQHESQVGSTHPAPVPSGARPTRISPSGSRGRAAALCQRLIAAGLVVTVCAAGFANGVSAQERYRVQAGDTLKSVAAEFGVDPEAIVRSSWLLNPPDLTEGDVIVIPDPGQSPEEAAQTAAELEGTSPWTSAAYWVESGDTIEEIAATYDVDPDDLLALNGLTWEDYIYPGDRLLIPGSSDAAAAVENTGEPATSNGRYLDARVWVPTHAQEHNLSCEYAAAFIATSAFDNPISESAFIDSIPITKNPHYGYRGNIDGKWGGFKDWGIYAEPLVPILNDYGFAAEVFYSMGDTTQLKAHLDEGHPVIVWLALWGDTGRVFHDEDRYTVFAGSHVMTAYGYDGDGIYLSDPGTGSYRFLTWDTFEWMWATIDGMSLAVYPA
jgi:LysM repeat protein/uncharacterized protein YvpB